MAVSDSTERIEVVREPLTYRQDAPFSFFRDLIDDHQGDYAAKVRLERHGREIADEMERREAAAWSAKPGDLEYRVHPNRTPGQGGNFAPPLWIIDHFATAPRTARVLSDLIPSFPLPQGVQSVNLPRLTVGTTVAPEPDLTGPSDTDATDAGVTSPVVVIAGDGEVSMQLLDQSPPGAHIDWAFFKDLSEAYDAQLEAQLINGSGSSGQLAGLLSLVPVSNQVTYTDAAPKATTMFPLLGQMIAHIGNNRQQPPEVWLMTTSRQGWIATSEDSQNRPLMIADKDGNGKFDLAAYEVDLDDQIPQNLGVGTNQDALLLCRPSDMILLESDAHTSVFTDVLSGTLQARLQLRRYVAALLGRYPSGIATLQGTGMVVQTGFSG